MKVSMFSKEIVQLDDRFLALPMVYSIGPIFIHGQRGCGSVNYCFSVNIIMEDGKKVNIYGDEIEYYLLKNYDDCEQDPIYLDKKIELAVVRDELLEIWSKYLDVNK